MTDELDQVVRALEAERHRPSVWWHTDEGDPDERRRQLEAALEAAGTAKKRAS